jgi:4-carboxymuconolactone decarboxylase
VTTKRPGPPGTRGSTPGPSAAGDVLRSLADLDGPAAWTPPPAGTSDLPPGDEGLDDRTAALARLAALVAVQTAPAAYARGVHLALAGGATADEVVSTLEVVAQIVGLARLVSAAPGLALALGYDIDHALETLDEPGHAVRRGPCR